MIILMGIALTILCICSVAELALLLLIFAKYITHRFYSFTPPRATQPAEPATDAEEIAKARKRYEEEMTAFQDLMNYNANVAYGIERREFEE